MEAIAMTIRYPEHAGYSRPNETYPDFYYRDPRQHKACGESYPEIEEQTGTTMDYQYVLLCTRMTAQKVSHG